MTNCAECGIILLMQCTDTRNNRNCLNASGVGIANMAAVFLSRGE